MEMEYVSFFKRSSECVGSCVVCVVDICDGGVVNYCRIVIDGGVDCYYCRKFNGFVGVYCV